MLLNGSEPRTANTPLRPRLVPVAQMRVSEKGEIVVTPERRDHLAASGTRKLKPVRATGSPFLPTLLL